MKNIHIIPTDKPSRFSLNSSGKYHLTNQLHTNSPNFTNQNIYITNDEEIKDGDWFTDNNNSLKTSYKLSHVQFANSKKIILTTDQDLINVQTIDDEFLEWFVKNPSCESVEVLRCPIEGLYTIIPKEEPKQETLEDFANEYSKKKYSIDYGYCEEDYYISCLSFINGAKWQQEQDKNRYSEEDMRKAIQETITLMRYKATEFREHENTVIEQFKKK